jgi:hypothetical protein
VPEHHGLDPQGSPPSIERVIHIEKLTAGYAQEVPNVLFEEALDQEIPAVDRLLVRHSAALLCAFVGVARNDRHRRLGWATSSSGEKLSHLLGSMPAPDHVAGSRRVEIVTGEGCLDYARR